MQVIRAPLVVAASIIATSLLAGGGPPYETPFVEPTGLGRVLAGDFPDQFPKRDVLALIAYIHLTGRFSEEHRRLFEPRTTDLVRPDFRTRFWETLREEGYEKPDMFRVTRLVSKITTVEYNGVTYSFTDSQFVDNCMHDAFKTALETLADRRQRYGSGSIELERWIQAQRMVFGQCSGEVAFVAPKAPEPDWQPLERHDRNYQIAASYFYAGRHLEAATRFRDIASNSDSPWRDLGRYLVARSLAREAVINENDPERHLQLALEHYRELARDPAYVAAFPSVTGQIRYVDAKLRPVALRRELEQRLIHNPAGLSRSDVDSYGYLLRLRSIDTDDTDYETWFQQATSPNPDIVLQRWRDERTPAWLYLALVHARAEWGSETLDDLLHEATVLSPDAPGQLSMRLHLIRIHGLLGDAQAGLRLAEEALRGELGKSDVNRVRIAAARIASNWSGYFSWAPLQALSLSWPDELARSLPPGFNRITRDTPLFSTETAALVNDYFTPSMILGVLDTAGLGDYVRGRMAIAGWAKAILADDLDSALALAARVRATIPALDDDFRAFQGAEDKRFEAARIVFDHPAISPWIRPGEGRIQYTAHITRPAPDHIATARRDDNWWCATSPSPDPEQRVNAVLPDVRFSDYDSGERDAIRAVVKARATAATTALGPHVLRYARNNLDDPRLPRTLHRLVFATRHACPTAPGSISRAAYALLHERFPESEWAEKTPYWYGRLE